ncbi:MAG TPA: ion channel [Polyangiaceae bacterium]|nr:ion channel [Polyangiaceae bacterium]
MSAQAGLPVGDDAAVLAVLASLAGAGAGGQASYQSWKQSLKTAVTTDPFDALVVTVLGGGFLFYLAEKGKNPKVKTYVDALLFLSTCLSVGYADVFAVTPAGKAIASAVMTFGPAMSGAIFDDPKGATAAAGSDGGAGAGTAELLAVQRAIVDKLDAILGELKASRPHG